MRISLSEWRARLPLPASEDWPQGVWDIEALTHGTLSVVLFAPRGTDYQSPHEQDELYVILTGTGLLEIEGTPHAFVAGDVVFVPARAKHRFVEFSAGLLTWAIFWGPQGGEEART